MAIRAILASMMVLACAAPISALPHDQLQAVLKAHGLLVTPPAR